MPDDLDLIQGSWTITALEVDGQAMPPAMLEAGLVTVKGNRFTSTGMGPVYEGVLKLKAKTSPRQFDLEFDAGPEKGNTNLGIYELNGDTWKICLATRGTVRPSSFVSTAGSGFAVETLTRGAVAKPKAVKARTAKNSSAAATEFEGEWQMISGVMNGQAMSKSDVQWVKRVTRGNQTSVIAGPQVLMSMQFTHDPAATPKTIEYVHTAGANKGKTQYGIYEFEGDVLKICASTPGTARPSEFESKPGDGKTFTVWKRVVSGE